MFTSKECDNIRFLTDNKFWNPLNKKWADMVIKQKAKPHVLYILGQKKNMSV